MQVYYTQDSQSSVIIIIWKTCEYMCTRYAAQSLYDCLSLILLTDGIDCMEAEDDGAHQQEAGESNPEGD